MKQTKRRLQSIRREIDMYVITMHTVYINPIQSGLFPTVNVSYDLENYCVNLHAPYHTRVFNYQVFLA